MKKKLNETLSGLAKAYLNNINEDSKVKFESDIIDTWVKSPEITNDIREYLMLVYNEEQDDFVVEDRINAIENGIREFRKITNI